MANFKTHFTYIQYYKTEHGCYKIQSCFKIKEDLFLKSQVSCNQYIYLNISKVRVMVLLTGHPCPSEVCYTSAKPFYSVRVMQYTSCPET